LLLSLPTAAEGEWKGKRKKKGKEKGKGMGKKNGEGKGEGKWGRRKGSGRKISYASQVIAHFVPNFVAMATGVGRGKMQLAALDGPSPKTSLQAQKSHRNLLRKPSHIPFRPKFRCHGKQRKGKGTRKENGEGK